MRVKGNRRSLYRQVVSYPAIVRMNILARTVTLACFAWSLAFFFVPSWFSELAGQFFPDNAKGGTPLVGFGFPLLIAALTCTAFATRPDYQTGQTRRLVIPQDLPPRIQVLMHSFGWKLRGESDVRVLAFLFILCPSVYYFQTLVRRDLSRIDTDDLSDIIKAYSNTIAMAGAMLLAVFLFVPVARHSSIMVGLFGTWSHASAVQLHIWAGRLAVLCVAAHALFYFYRWKFVDGEESIWNLIFPPGPCWTLQETDYEPECGKNACSCYKRFRNGAGVLAGLCFLTIAMTSWNPIRRRFYEWFYKIHIILGPTSALLVLLHWKRAMVYLAGAILFYLGSSMPVWIENWLQLRRDGGVKLHSIERLVDCNCTSLTFEASDTALSRFQPGQYVRLFCPQISSVAHPFTINTVPGQGQQMRVIFRSTGSFTRRLAAQDSPALGLDGFHGRADRLSQVLQHDTVLFLAGGIGITPYLSLLHQVHAAMLTPQTTKKIILHWVCREAGLIQYVQQAYLEPLMWSDTAATGFQIQIVVHRTGLKQNLSDNPAMSDGVEERIVPENSGGVPFYPSQFAAASKNSFRANLPLILSFWTTSILGLLTSWYCYSHIQNDHEMVTRLWSPALLVVLSFVVAMAVNLLSLRNEDEVVSADWSPVQSLELHQSSPGAAVVAKADASDVTLPCPVSLQTSEGRPDIGSLLRPLHTAQYPAVFVCGPDAMTEQLSKELGLRTMWDPRRYLPQQRVSVYAESFYM